MLVLAKQHIYECRNKCTYPSFTIFLDKVSYVHQLEKKLMNSNNKVADQESKWEKFQLFCRGSENSTSLSRDLRFHEICAAHVPITGRV